MASNVGYNKPATNITNECFEPYPGRNIWLGPVKPKMDILLKPILEKLEVYYTKGIIINTCAGEKILKAKLLLCVFDLVARPLAVNTVQFNGYFGCLYCLHEGVYKFRRLLYPPLDHYLKRCKDDMERWATMAENSEKPVYGVKVTPYYQCTSI